nr:DUF1173 family protein [Aquincola tertiaricarbonis]
MDTTGDIDGSRPRYALEDEVLDPHDPGFMDAVGQAYARQLRPRCLCQPEGVPMYIAHWRPGFLVKRMAGTGAARAPDCGSHEPPLEWSGRGGGRARDSGGCHHRLGQLAG